jgi:uncharacterized protein
VRAWASTGLFVAGAFAVSWGFWAAAAALSPAPAVAALLFLPGTLAPAAVGLWVTHRDGGRPAVSALVARLFAWRVAWPWYLFALGFMAAAKLAAALLHRLIEGSWPAVGEVPFVLMLLSALLSTPVQAGEEIGWRGVLLPRLAQRIGYAPAGLVVGVVWASWHLPLFFLPGGDLAGQSFAVFVLSVTALSVAMTWLYASTGGSLLLTMLMHAAVNNTTGIVPAAGHGGAAAVFGLQAPLIGWLTVAVLAAAAAACMALMPKAPRGFDPSGPPA